MTNLKNKKAVVIDNGMFIELAIRLSRDFGQVDYFNEWATSEYPLSKDARVGYGIPEINVIETFWDKIDDYDIFIFPSIYKSDWQIHLEDLGERVYGSRNGDQLELDRTFMHQKLADLGLPQPKVKKIKGIDSLIEHLDTVEDKWIKVSKFRGKNETWHHIKPGLSDRELKNKKYELGDEGSIAEFHVWDAIDGIEWGTDFPITVDGLYPERVLYGIEEKDCCYLGKVKAYKDISPLLTDFNAKIAPTLKKRRYRNMMSTEVRVGKDKVPYMVDFTARFPSPPGEIYLELISNISEVIWNASEGRLVEPEYAAKYAIEVMINSDAAENDWVNVSFPENIRKWIKLRNFAIIDDKYCIIPRNLDFNNIGAVVAIGNTVEETEKKAKSYCDQIEGEGVKCKMGDVSKVMETIKKAETIAGIKW